MSISYRKDIDGLRAIAVLSVLFFHAGIEGFRGGFVGVDVFFVISGYLITGLIYNGLKANTFSLSEFYARRIRRIFPALFTLLFFAALASWFLLLPSELIEFGKTFFTASASVSNIYFWKNVGYFAPRSELNLLLHTWSLAVEEQFYLIFPLVFVFLYRSFGIRKTFAALVVTILFSLALAEWQVNVRPTAVFYLLPPRAWQLMLGSLLAISVLPERHFFSLFAGLCGLALIVFSVVMLEPGISFPGINALPPCVGTALILYAGRNRSAGINAFLGAAPFVFFGRISYSLYLWHWPLLVLPRIVLDRALQPHETWGLLLVSTIVATISWRCVETPLRKLPQGANPIRTIWAGVITSILFGVIGLFIVLGNGFPSRFSDEINAADRAQIEPPIPASCVGYDKAIPTADCDTKAIDILVWGDSHARHFYPPIAKLAQDRGLHVQLQSTPACPPLLDVIPMMVGPFRATTPGNRVYVTDYCRPLNTKVISLLKNKPSIKTVWLAGAWTFWTEIIKLETEEQNLLSETGAVVSAERSRELFEKSLRETVSQIKALGREVILIGQIPDYRQPPSQCLARAYFNSSSIERCQGDATFVRQRLQAGNILLRKIAEDYQTKFIEVSPFLCDDARCTIILNGEPAYMDGNHLTPSASMSLVDVLSQGFASQSRK